jgi:hypothetical protein
MSEKYYPVVDYTHCLLTRPMKVFKYKKLACKSEKMAGVLAKILAMYHDYFACWDKELGIRYGVGKCQKEKT